MAELRAQSERMVADVVEQLQATESIAQHITSGNKGLAASIVRAALDECLSAIDPGTPIARDRHAWADLRCAYGNDSTVIEVVPRVMGSLIWRRVADVGLTCGMDQESLTTAADALFAHLCELQLPRR